MDKEISLARQEAERRSVLLANAGVGEAGVNSICRDKRQEEIGNVEGDEEEKTLHPPAQSKSNATPKRDGRKRRRKRGGTYTLRKPARAVEDRNRDDGRSAQELGIEWLDARCELAPSNAHYLTARTWIDGGCIWECKYCHKITWLPSSLNECQRLGSYLRIYGLDTGFCKMLDLHHAAKRMLAQMQDIYYLKKLFPDNYGKILACMVEDKSYPYDVEVVEEEMP